MCSSPSPPDEMTAVRGDAATLEWIRDRLVLKGEEATRIDSQLQSVETTAKTKDLKAAADAAARLARTVSGLT